MKKSFSIKSIFFILFSFQLSIINYQLHAQPGSLDSSFGVDGRAVFSSAALYGGSIGHSTQKSGKIIQLAWDGGFVNLIRYNADGSIDESFGDSGVAQASYTDLGYTSLYLSGINVQQDDKILVVGFYFHSPGDYYARSAAVMRYNEDGSIDESFGNQGITSMPFKDGLLSSLNTNRTIAIDPEERIIISGGFEGNHSSYSFVIRYLPDGSPDESFGDKGMVSIDFIGFNYSNFRAADIALQKDDMLLVGGDAYNFNDPDRFAVTRLFQNGVTDSSYGVNGFALAQFNNNKHGLMAAIGLQSNGKIVATGTTQKTDFSKTDIALTRFSTDGKLDESFGEKGIVITHIADGYYEEPKDIALQSNNKIVMAYYLSKIQFSPDYFELYHYTENGATDSSFGENGRVTTDFTDLTGRGGGAQDVSIEKGGKILATGAASYSYALARYYGDPVNQHPLITKIKRWIRNHILNFQDMGTTANTAYYTIERSNNATMNFTEVARRTPNTSNSYSYSDNAASTESNNYYRIKAVGNDGSITYSDVVSETDYKTSSSVIIYPNPVKDVLHVSGLNASDKTSLSIINAQGNVIKKVSVNATSYELNVKQLQRGTYYLKINDTNSYQFIKE